MHTRMYVYKRPTNQAANVQKYNLKNYSNENPSYTVLKLFLSTFHRQHFLENTFVNKYFRFQQRTLHSQRHRSHRRRSRCWSTTWKTSGTTGKVVTVERM